MHASTAHHTDGMVKTIVIPLDGSEFAARALPAGIALALRANATVLVIGIARWDAELASTYDHVHAHAKRAGLAASDVEIRVHPDPVEVLLGIADLEGTTLCFASHDRMPPNAKLLHSVGSALIERARKPLVVVGANSSTVTPGGDVVVALDGIGNAEPLLAVGAAWALSLDSSLRIVTVYEPIPSDLRRPEHFTRHHGPPGDPDVYVTAMAERVADVGLRGVETVAVADPVSVAAGLLGHLADAPARLLVLGGGHGGPTVARGIVRHVLDQVEIPVLIVNRST